jgi:parallel beta-helix repeat protein
VNLGSYYIEVNGTLSARGSPSDKITFNGGQITFTSFSNGWNEQTDSGSLIENTNINQTSINSSNQLKIDSSNINGQVSVTSSIISNNIVTSEIYGANSTISNNVVKGDMTTQVSSTTGAYPTPSESSVVSNNIVTGNINIGFFNGLAVSGDSSTVFNNTVNGSISTISGEGSPEIYNNTVTNGGIRVAGDGSIFDNIIYGCPDGISISTPRGFGGDLPCDATVENNLIVDNTQGIDIDLASVFGPGTVCPTILNNTISGNSVGIYLSESYYNSTPTIQNNNLQNNSNYNFDLAAPNSVDVTYNWWGTSDPQAINQTIYDYKNDFTLGTVNFVPYLTAPNPQTTPNPNETIPTPASTPTQSISPFTNQTSTQSPSPPPATTSSSHSSASPSQNPTASPQANKASSIQTDLTVTGIAAIVIVAVAIGAFLLGKRAGQKIAVS